MYPQLYAFFFKLRVKQLIEAKTKNIKAKIINLINCCSPIYNLNRYKMYNKRDIIGIGILLSIDKIIMFRKFYEQKIHRF